MRTCVVLGKETSYPQEEPWIEVTSLEESWLPNGLLFSFSRINAIIGTQTNILVAEDAFLTVCIPSIKQLKYLQSKLYGHSAQTKLVHEDGTFIFCLFVCLKGRQWDTRSNSNRLNGEAFLLYWAGNYECFLTQYLFSL